MAAPPGLKLLGNWASHFTHRVQLALKLKGLQYEYQEEDMSSKSSSLLLHNPVYKMVPVLLHGGRAVAESLVILEYIDEMWPHRPILPQDPYERAVARFWCHFASDKLSPSAAMAFLSSGEKQREAIQDFLANMDLLEAELHHGHLRGRRFLSGDYAGLLDIVIGCASHWYFMVEEACGIEVLESNAFPSFRSWFRRFHELEVVKEVVPDRERLRAHATAVRSRFLGSSGACAQWKGD